MKAIWSLWSKPLLQSKNIGLWSFHHFLYSWIISVLTSSRFFNRTELYTDDFGKYILIDILKLPFDQVHICLNGINNLNKDWWAAGKILTYSLQNEPFIHLDSDVFLWEGLPERILSSKIFAQSPEFFNKLNSNSYYKLSELEELIKDKKGWLPKIWFNHTADKESFEASCCGIFGGNDLKLIEKYSKTALKIILHKKNQIIWEKWPNVAFGNVLIEQFFLALTVSTVRRTKIEYLFDNLANPFSPLTDNKIYTHLISTSKNDSSVQKLIERFVFLNCLEYVPRTRHAVMVLENESSKY
jgi:hypothetical protein